ncbi:hypothetical protein QBC47DRAFT_378370 [Echria macrotheca]|uniref:N-acetyltransferase domain-containing protein n=1 Tax=Echria macrotheca TaxID=438768 RepID=A0AAJ0FB71_9PEZI|nr:hypothetical protein QBC47DRAFT_378370 [Echria macrotheca]
MTGSPSPVQSQNHLPRPASQAPAMAHQRTNEPPHSTACYDADDAGLAACMTRLATPLSRPQRSPRPKISTEMTTPQPQFHIRDAVSSPSNTDAHYILSAFDSCIPHLATIGSATQWGSEPFSSRPNILSRPVSAIAAAETYRTKGEGDPVRVFIIEVPGGPEQENIQLGAAIYKANWFPEYIKSQPQFRDAVKAQKKWMYLDMLVTEFSARTEGKRKGAGAALVRRGREWAREEGFDVMYVDCWAGNEGKLVRFYESQGFKRVGAFEVEKPDTGEKWPGMFLKMDLTR